MRPMSNKRPTLDLLANHGPTCGTLVKQETHFGPSRKPWTHVWDPCQTRVPHINFCYVTKYCSWVIFVASTNLCFIHHPNKQGPTKLLLFKSI